MSPEPNRPSLQRDYRPVFVAAGWFGGLEFDCNKELITLWKLLPRLPASISGVIAQYLPPPLTEEIPLDTPSLLSISEGALSSLLFRDDVHLNEFRLYVLHHHKELPDFVVAAALSNIGISFSDFHSVLNLPADERANLLVYLIECSTLPLSIIEASYDHLQLPDTNSWRLNDIEFPSLFGEQRHVQDRMEKWKGYGDCGEQDLRWLRLYRLARRCVPVNAEHEGSQLPEDELGFLRERLVKGDTWATFINFVEAWDRHTHDSIHPDARRLEEYLPRVADVDDRTAEESRIGEPAAPTPRERWNDSVDSPERWRRSIEHKVSVIGNVLFLSVAFALFLHLEAALPSGWSISKEVDSFVAIGLAFCLYSFLLWGFHKEFPHRGRSGAVESAKGD